ncbi:MAG TPA: DUF3311 domain-containing protein [Xanthobacteraceae bacterium]|nr:DUF3311 domain-containing protein [Xanthobacteraceae bacterium]
MSVDSSQAKTQAAKPSHRRAWVLIIPFIAMVIPPLFNYREPSIAGLPFFYWYLLLWIPLTAFLTWVAYRR